MYDGTDFVSKDAPGLRERARLEVMWRLRSATVTLLREKSFSEITTREVAQRAGVGEATLFRHVGSKQDLLILAYGDQMDDLLDEMDASDKEIAASQQAPTGLDFCDRVRNLYKMRADFYLHNPENAAAYLRHGFDPKGTGRLRTMAQGDRMIERAAEILRSGQLAAVLMPNIDASLVAQNCQGIFIHEVDRTSTRGFDPTTIWKRVNDRLTAQLDPLILPRPGPRRGSEKRRS